ncbi:hypothetical protein [Aliivibrio fischeri]|uniref:hypothetical protein n=1 Tax=Aliivibrio fischeri TaxID=668 RepID=UPI0012D8B5DE|nr:hypothetical protein [Aliivibrio fischeri]MUJ19513.1 hypothetical protein [Aliivibrio fischeri]
MTHNELFKLTNWYYSNVIDTKLYDTLNQANIRVNGLLSSNSSYGIPHLKPIFNILYNTISQIDYKSLSIDDLNALKKNGLENIILEPAIPVLQELFLGNKTDIHTISSRVISMLNTVKEADVNFKNLQIILPQLFDIKSSEEDYTDKVLTRLTFHNDASIENVVNLSDWSNSWNKVARGYGMVLGHTPEDFEVISASKGSIIFDLLLNLETVNMLGETFNHIADFAFTMIEIKAALKGISYFKTLNPEKYEQLKAELQSDLDKKNDEMAEDIAQKLFEKYSIDENNHEAKIPLKHAVKEVSKFINKGGDINFKTDDLDKEDEVLLVNEALLMLKNRSKEQKLIEDKKEED